uniref:Uncharacterized protein n=1 Tax=Anguilla anguilla TaxID=7936 RepID=A0A0E9PPZ5_ANGAN
MQIEAKRHYGCLLRYVCAYTKRFRAIFVCFITALLLKVYV